MTIKSLQEIIKLENELSAAEKAEQEKAELWLQEQEAEILRHHKEALETLEEKKKGERARAEKVAREKAETMISQAKKRAAYLDSIDEAVLRSHLKYIHNLMAGQIE